MKNGARVNLRVQPGLVVGWLADDPGDWVFTLCRRGMEELLDRKLRINEELQVIFSAEVVDEHI